jgi:hypothetical protein
MDAMWVIYLGDIVSDINFVCAIVLITIVAAFVISFFAGLFNATLEPIKMVYKFSIVPLILFSFVGIVIPQSKTVYMMAAAKVGQDVATSPEAKEIGGKLMKLLNEKLDEQLKTEKK